MEQVQQIVADSGVSGLVSLMAQNANDAETQRLCCDVLPTLLADVNSEACAQLVEATHAAVDTHLDVEVQVRQQRATLNSHQMFPDCCA